jgi:prepilin-type N-terminal cleavage/methylation domain-containing protein
MEDSERRTRCASPARSCGGFTLIEVLVAAVILAIGLVGVASMVYYGVLSHQKSAHYTIAGQRAMQEMERIRDASYVGAVVDLTLFPSPSYQIVDSSTARFSVPELTNGQGTITIAEDTEAQAINPATGQPYQNMKRVTVTITWGGSRRSSGAYNLATLIANRP